MRLEPNWEANIKRLKALGDGVFTLVVQQGQIRTVAPRSKDVDNVGGADVSLPSADQGHTQVTIL